MKKIFKFLVLISIIILAVLLISGVDIDIKINTEKIDTYAYYNQTRISSNELIAKPPSAAYEQIYQWAVNNNASDLYLEVLPIIWKKSVDKGIDPVIVATQCALETGFLSKGNAMSGGHNTCGMKSSKNLNKYAEYDSWNDGFQAQVNHLALYSGISGNANSWLYGRCKTVKQLTGLWAEDKKYDVKLMNMINAIHNTKISSDLKIYNNPTTNKENVTIKKKNSKKDKSYRTIEKIVKDQNKNKLKVNKIVNSVKPNKSTKTKDKLNNAINNHVESKKIINTLKKKIKK